MSSQHRPLRRSLAETLKTLLPNKEGQNVFFSPEIIFATTALYMCRAEQDYLYRYRLQSASPRVCVSLRLCTFPIVSLFLRGVSVNVIALQICYLVTDPLRWVLNVPSRPQQRLTFFARPVSVYHTSGSRTHVIAPHLCSRISLCVLLNEIYYGIYGTANVLRHVSVTGTDAGGLVLWCEVGSFGR